MIQTREEFKQWVDANWSNISTEANSPLWIPEHDLQSALCGWFVTVPPLRLSATGTKSEYWSWCKENLHGHTRCFYSDPDGGQECWGFTEYQDTVLWILKFAK